MQNAAKQKPIPTLDALYSLVRDDLKRVDQLILSRVNSELLIINSVVHHIIASGGKRIRPALMLIAAQLCDYVGDIAVDLASAIEFLHTATLLHDDVVDESKLRRGLSTANEAFGNKASILVGDFLLGQAFQLMAGTGSVKTLKILSDAAARISRGEVMQMIQEGQVDLAAEPYLEMISAKTAVLFSASCELGAVVSGKVQFEAPLRDYGMNMGIAFQLVDDALDYNADQRALGKTVGDDFREGKITLPVLIAYQQANEEERDFWRRTITDKEQRDGDFTQAAKLIASHKAIGRTIQLAEEYAEKAKQNLADFPESAAKDAMIELTEFCIHRAY
jgi:octaprenyl-diphosphate synthase